MALLASRDHQHFIRQSFVITPVVVNFILNGLIAWLVYGSRTAVSVWAIDGLLLDTALTLFLIASLTCLIVVPIVWQSLEQGDQSAVGWTRQDYWWLAWLPAGKYARTAVVGLLAAVVVTPILLGSLTVLGISTLDGSAIILFKALYCALFAGLITPYLALASLGDVSASLSTAENKAVTAIPLAQLPTGAESHVKAMQNDMIGYIEEVGRQGDLLRIPLFGPVYGYFINDPDLVREVLVKQAANFHKPFNVKAAANGVKVENLFTTDGELWQVLRKVMQPAFHARRIENYATIMVEDTQEMLAGWTDGEQIEIPEAMMDLTLASVTKALFGQDMRQDDAAQAIARFIQLFYARISASLPLPGWIPTPSNRDMKEQLAIIERWLQPMIDERKAAADLTQFDDVLSMLIEAQRVDTTGLLTDHQVRTEIMNLFVAGYEVVANTLSFTLYLVSQNPEVETKLNAELEAVLGDDAVSLATLGQLSYVEMVLKESMRLLPVTTVLIRQTAVRVELNGYILPKNRLILFAPWVLQRSAENFADPLTFQPERFHPKHGEDFPRYAYLPFSGGPRICIGNAFAMMQMKINLATIWQTYRLTLAEGYTFEPFYAFNTRPKDGLPMVVHRKKVPVS